MSFDEQNENTFEIIELHSITDNILPNTITSEDYFVPDLPKDSQPTSPSTPPQTPQKKSPAGSPRKTQPEPEIKLESVQKTLEEFPSLVAKKPDTEPVTSNVIKDLKERVNNSIEEMTTQHQRQGSMVDHKKLKILVETKDEDYSYDPVLTVAVANVNAMLAPPTTGKAVKGADVLKGPTTVVNGKKIKITQQMIEAAYKKLKKVIKDKPSTENIAIIVAYALQISNEMLTTSKTYKIELALAILRKLVDEEVDNAETRVMIHMLIETTVPTLINTISGLPSLFAKLCAKCKCCAKPAK